MKCPHPSPNKLRLSVIALGLALGICWALGILFLGLVSAKFPEYGNTFINTLSSVYVGFNPTPKGILLGTLWALIDGFIGGAIIALIYNVLTKTRCAYCNRFTSSIEVKNFNHPDEQRTLPKTKMDVVTVGNRTIMRITLEPGWKWSECVKPTVGTDSCLTPHVNYILSGKLKIIMDNGVEKEAGPGDIMAVGPGHEAWVIGNEPCVALDFISGEIYGKK